MFYIWTLDAHELHGPFKTREAAHAYAKLRQHSAYSIETDAAAQNERMAESLRLVPAEHRGF